MEVDYIMNPYLEYVTEQVKYLYGWYKKGDEPNKETKRKVNKFDEVEIDIGKNNKIMRKLSQFCDRINGNDREELIQSYFSMIRIRKKE